MPCKASLIFGKVEAGKHIVLDDRHRRIAPQPAPTSPRIKDLLSRGLTAPQTLSSAEIQELAASVVYDLITRKVN